MKTLSLKQPFAELVVSGKKTIELRSWNTKFRGEFLVHASKGVDVKAMEKFGFFDVKKYSDEEEHKIDIGKHLANSFCGNYGFVLTDACRIENIVAKGKLNFWDFEHNGKE